MWKLPQFFLLLLVCLQLHRSLSIDFVFNDFTGHIGLYGTSALESIHGRQYLALTNTSKFSIGRALYNSTVRMKSPDSSRVLPFYSSFVFSVAPATGFLPGHGFAFLFSPLPGTQGSTSAQHLGLFNRTTDGKSSNGVVAVEFDVFENEEFNDIDANHVGIDVFSLSSDRSCRAGYWATDDDFVPLTLNDGSIYQAWVEYSREKLTVTMAPVSLGRKPRRPLLSLDLDLSPIFKEEMYVGFCAATGVLVENHRILGWSFSTSNSSLSEALILSNLPNFVPDVESRSPLSKALIVGISSAAAVALVAIAAACLVAYRKRRWSDVDGAPVDDLELEDAPVETWESEYWPHRISYREVHYATEGFSERNLIGSGGNGRVYRGVLAGVPVAMKQFGRSTGEEEREFLAEVSSLGRLQHRNLVGLKGWCRKAGGDLILVYEYMENGSLDRRIFPEEAGDEGVKEKHPPLDWPSRVRMLKDVAAGVLYLHEGWESRVLHRDIKASNVMLDGDMVARLGDFGLARIHPHGGTPRTTRVMGTVGYIAPEIMRNGKATAATDVFAFGVLVLEVACGRRPVLEGSAPLIEWVWDMAERGMVEAAVDPGVKGMEGFDAGEAERVVRLGLWCTCAEPAVRPAMRHVVRALDGGKMAGIHGLEGPGSDEVDDALGRSAEGYLLERLRSPPRRTTSDGLSCYQGTSAGPDHHPTLEQLRLESSTVLSMSDMIVEGR